MVVMKTGILMRGSAMMSWGRVRGWKSAWRALVRPSRSGHPGGHANAVGVVAVKGFDGFDDAGPLVVLPSMVRSLWGLDSFFFTGGCTETERWGDGAELVDITPKAGGISLHHCLALHGSENNQSGRPRRGLVFQYRADDAFQLADTVFADTGMVVSGQRRGKVRCQEAVWTLPKRRDGFGSAWNQIGSEVPLE